jgi:general secretion pathway protein L
MSVESLIFIAGAEPSDPLPWVRLRDGEPIERGVAGPGERGGVRAAPPARTALVLRASEAHIKRQELPARTEAQARAAAALLFEKDVVGAGALHYAVGAVQNETGARLIAAISPERLTAWLARCRVHGADPQIVALDCTVLPQVGSDIEAVETADRYILASGDGGGLSLEPALARAVASRWLAQLQRTVRTAGYAGPDAAGFARLLEPGVQLIVRASPDLDLALARGVLDAGDHTPNLRQGVFAPAGGRSRAATGWRVAAGLAALSILLNAGVAAYSGWRDASAATRVIAQAEENFRKARPDIKQVSNLRAQVAALSNAASRAERHPVLATADPLVRALLANPGVRLDELTHQAPEAGVRLRLSSEAEPALAATVEHLRAQGLRVTPGAQAPVDGRPSLELTLEAAP